MALALSLNAFAILLSGLSAVAASPLFPLRISADHRHLEDAGGKPFLVHGDAAWSLIAELKREEVDIYLADRQQRGFNTILVSLIEHHWSSHPPFNAYCRAPFRQVGAFDQPNDDYFEDARWIVRRAEEKGLLVLLVPAYLGVSGGDEGWYREMREAGPDKLRAYGEYVGRKFKDFSNIVWVLGGDYDAPDKDLIRALADGIDATNPGILRTVHSSRETVTRDYWRGETWLDFDTTYTYGDVYRAVAAQTTRPDRMPVLMIEGLYEGEHNVDEQGARAQAYGAILAGAAGHVFGNGAIWHFSGPGVVRSFFGWRHSLSSGGARGMTYLKALFDGLEWWKLEPDQNRVLVDSIPRRNNRQPVAGTASDRSFFIAYLPGTGAVTLDLGSLAKGEIVARWFDPTSGEFHPAADSPFGATGQRTFTRSSVTNRNSFNDWVLVLTCVPQP